MAIPPPSLALLQMRISPFWNCLHFNWGKILSIHLQLLKYLANCSVKIIHRPRKFIIDKKVHNPTLSINLNNAFNLLETFDNPKCLPEVGFNYRLPNLNSALGCAQLEKIETKITRKRKLFELYQEEFKNLLGVSLLKEPTHSRSNYWLQAIMLEPKFSSLRNEILDQTNEIGISTRPVWDLLTSLEHLKLFPRMDVTQAEQIANSLINLPSSPQLVKVQK